MLIAHTDIPPMPARPRKKAGFTIVEALTALIILGLCTVALFTSLHFGFHLVNDIRENIIASSIMQEEMEELRKSLFVSLPSYGQSTFTNDSLSLLYNSSGTVTVDQYVDSDILRVALTVAWSPRLKPEKVNIKRMVTLITKNGINSI